MIECWIVRVRYEDCFVSRALDMTSAIALASEKMHKLRGDIRRFPLQMACPKHAKSVSDDRA
jgi:hypothetical protein